MKAIEYSTTDNTFSPLNLSDKVLNAIPQPKTGCGNKVIISTLALAVLVSQTLDIADYKLSFPTSRPAYEPIENFDTVTSIEEPFTFKSRAEVLRYIQERPDVLNLYKSLHVMIEDVFGDVGVRLSVFKDHEESWSNLRVEIDSGLEVRELLEKEDQLFTEIEKDKSFIAALEYVTISCV